MSSISTEEQQKYWAIFSGLNPVNGFLDGQQAGQVLSQSRLSEDKLADVWDRADIDQDGQLDFEEFCVAMRLVFDIMNGVYVNVPPVLPDFLIPGNKRHLITANAALEHGLDVERPEYEETDDPSERGLKDNFDWYMSPADKASYESIYSANADRRGGVKFDRLTELYGTLDVPDREIEKAWTLINPKLADAIGKDQVLVFLHILNQRHQGSRIPRNVPASLRATFEKSEISYDTSKYDKSGKPKGDAQSQGFGGAYMNKLGIGSRGASKPVVDNSADVKDGDWETIRLKRELADLEAQIASAERTSKSAPDTNSGNLLVRGELEQLLNFKNAELSRLDQASGHSNSAGGLKDIQADIELFKEQVDSLSEYLKERQTVLANLEQERSTL